MPLDAARLRALADELEAEETEAARKLAEADTMAEREQLKTELAAVRAELDELKQQGAPPSSSTPPSSSSDDDDDQDDDAGVDKPKMRKGRKHGQMYQDRPGEPGYIYQGDDEPDLVPVDDDAAAA